MPPTCVATADAGCPGYSNIMIPEEQINTSDWMRIRSDIECFFAKVKTFRACQDRIRTKLAGNEEDALQEHSQTWSIVLGLFNSRMCPGMIYEEKYEYLTKRKMK